MLGVLVAYYAVTFSLLIVASYPTSLTPHRLLFKVLTSCGFMALACYFGWMAGFPKLFWLMLPAFGLCFVGDVFMALTDNAAEGGGWNDKVFLVGVAAFALAHLGFIGALTVVQPFSPFEPIVPVCCLMLAVGLTRLPKMETGSLTRFIYVYAVLVSWLFSKTLVWLLVAGPSAATVMATTGGLLFLLSDMLLLFIYFYQKKFKPVRFLNLFTYYLAMGLLSALVVLV